MADEGARALALALVIPLAWPRGWNRRQSSPADATPVRIRSLAVLPLENLSGDDPDLL
jgi:hypothetical protein